MALLVLHIMEAPLHTWIVSQDLHCTLTLYLHIGEWGQWLYLTQEMLNLYSSDLVLGWDIYNV
jgi:hypothetical protein